MSSDSFLTDAELVRLTGYKRGAEQVKWLEAHDWLHETNAAGAPIVARAYFERRLVGEASVPDPTPAARHNFGALRLVK